MVKIPSFLSASGPWEDMHGLQVKHITFPNGVACRIEKCGKVYRLDILDEGGFVNHEETFDVLPFMSEEKIEEHLEMLAFRKPVDNLAHLR